MQQQHKKQDKHSNTLGQAKTSGTNVPRPSTQDQQQDSTAQRGAASRDKFDQIFGRSGLGTGGVARDTINFIQSSLRSEVKSSRIVEETKLGATDKELRQIVNQPPLEKSMKDRLIQLKPFLSNHGSQVPRSAVNKQKKWNTGTVDVYKKYADSIQDIEADLNNMQKDVTAKNTQFGGIGIIGEYARYQGDSDKSDSARERSRMGQDPETQRYEQKVMAMRSRDRETDELDKMMQNSGSEDSMRNAELGLQEDQDFDREMQKIQAEKIQTTSRYEKKSFETDARKWEGTGLEDEFRKEYQNPMERKKAKKKDKKGEVKAVDVKPIAPKIITGPPSCANISQTSNLQNHLNLESTLDSRKGIEPLFKKSTPVSYMTLDGPVHCEKPLAISGSKKAIRNTARLDPTTAGSIEASYQTISENLHHRNQKERMRNTMQCQSRFFALQKAVLLPNHISQNRERLDVLYDGSSVGGKKVENTNKPLGSGINMVKLVPSQLLGSKQDKDKHVQQYGLYQDLTAVDQPSPPQGRNRKIKQSQNLSQFGQLTQQVVTAASQQEIPMVKHWFESLDLDERVLAVSTVDLWITETIKQMQAKQRKAGLHDQGKFRMITNRPATAIVQIRTLDKDGSSTQFKGLNDNDDLGKINCLFNLTNSQAHRSTPEVADAELELLNYIRFTDSNEMHDTLTVSEDLLRDPQNFYNLAETIVGANYLKAPHEVRWLGEKEFSNPFSFQSHAPLWLDMHQPSSLAAWLLYYLERALFITYKNNVYGEFAQCRDQNKQPVFIAAAGRNIVLFSELKPFWRTFCEQGQEDGEGRDSVEELLQDIKSKAMQEFEIQTQDTKEQDQIGHQNKERRQIDALHGGLSLHNDNDDARQQLLQRIEQFTSKVEDSIHSFQLNQDSKEDNPKHEGTPEKSIQLNFRNLCQNMVIESSLLYKTSAVDIKNKFREEAKLCRAARERQASRGGSSLLNGSSGHVDMKLERIFIEQFRQHINSKLKSQFTTQNKKVQKRKIKKLKKKEQDQEREREERERNEREQQVKHEQQAEGTIQLNNNKAIEMLLGGPQDQTQIQNTAWYNPEQPKVEVRQTKTVEEIKQGFQDIKEKKKKNKKNKKKGKQPENKDEEQKNTEEQKEHLAKDQDLQKASGVIGIDCSADKNRTSNMNQKEVITNNIHIIQKFPQKPSTPKQIQQQKTQTSNTKIDPQNYFQVLGHKYAASLESQNEIRGHQHQDNISSQKSSEISGIVSSSNQNTQDMLADQRGINSLSGGGGTTIRDIESSRCGTIRTLSTCEESKKTRQQNNLVLNQRVQNTGNQQASQGCAGASHAMSNEEILKIQLSESSSRMSHRLGNAMIQNRQWQRKLGNDRDIRGMINELISESSSNMGRQSEGFIDAKFDMIDVRVKGNKLHAQIDGDDFEDFDDQSSESNGPNIDKASGQSSSSIEQQKRRVKQRKPQPGKAKARKPSSSDSGSSQSDGNDSDQDLLPDLYSSYIPQPEDNDSSDYGAKEGEIDDENDEDESFAEDDSSVALSNSKKVLSKSETKQSAKEKQMRSPQILKNLSKISEQNKNIVSQNRLNKKSIKSAHPKIESQDKIQDKQEKDEKQQTSEDLQVDVSPERPSQQSDERTIQRQILMNAKAKAMIKRRQQTKNKAEQQFKNRMNNLNEQIIDPRIPEAIIEQERIINCWIRLRDNEPLTCQKIVMAKEFTTESRDEEQKEGNESKTQNKNKGNKKNKKQKKLDWQNKYANLANVEPRQIEIIKPEIMKPEVQGKKETKAGDQNKGGKEALIMDKGFKKKKKEVNAVEAMNSFIKRLAGPESKPLSEDRSSSNSQIAEKPKDDRKDKDSKKETHKEDKIGQKKETGVEQAKSESTAKKDQAAGQKGKPDAVYQKKKDHTNSHEVPESNQSVYSKHKNQSRIPGAGDQQIQQSNLHISGGQLQFQKKGIQITHQSNPQQRLSNIEEAKILGTGNYRYEAKKPQQSSASAQDLKNDKEATKEEATKQNDETNRPSVPSAADQSQRDPSQRKSPQLSEEFKSAGGLNIESKEYKVSLKPSAQQALLSSNRTDQNMSGSSKTTKRCQIESKAEPSNAFTASQAQQQAPSEKKKKAQKKRSNKHKKKSNNPATNQLQDGQWFPPYTGEGHAEFNLNSQVGQSQPAHFDLSQSSLSQKAQQIQKQLDHLSLPAPNQGGNYPGLGGAIAQGSQSLSFNQQVQDLLYKLNETVLVQQQQQIAEMHMRQQQEADSLIQEECEPCAEIDAARYDLFFEELEQEMKNKVKEIDELKDSVRKERQGFITIIENIVKDTFSNKYGNGYVGIKIFGSMATELAIETSDVDLVVTGISSFGSSGGSQYSGYGKDQYSGGKNQLLRMMQKLQDNLQYLKDKGQINKIKFIQTANVPIIKLVVDLQAINERQIQTAVAQEKRDREQKRRIDKQRNQDDEDMNEQLEEQKQDNPDQINLSQLGVESKSIDDTMRYLKVDISIDEQSHQFLKHESMSNFYGGVANRSHSGIDTIYHIQELVLKRKDLRPIVMIIKKIFDETFLSMPYYGGISSYSLVLMVSAYLNRFDADKQESLSRNLSGFFHFYGVGFKPHLFYLNGDAIEFCQDPAQRPFSDPFIVLDPLDPSNNISHSTFRIKDLQRALIKAFKIINVSCEKSQLAGQGSAEETPSGDDRWHTPKNVLSRLMTEIREDYQQFAIDDDL